MTSMQLYPPAMEPRTLTRQVWSVDTARSIPGVGRALDLIGGLCSQMPLDRWRGITPLTRTPFLDRPDLDKDRPTFVALCVVDFLVHGNACLLVTARGADGWPAAVRWFPAAAWHVVRDDRTGRRRYWLNGREVAEGDVVHVQNGADPLNDARGVGVLERYVNALDRVALQDERQRTDTAQGFVPSVAVIAPQGDDSTDAEKDELAARLEAKLDARHGGRRPAIFPHGTGVIPLSWNPNDAQAGAARAASLTDVANMFGLDGYWLGAPASSHTYRTPGPLFLVLLRTTINRLLAPFEAAWSQAWLPYGQTVVFGRDVVLADDFATTIATLTKATGRPVMTLNEARARLSLAPVDGGDELATAPAAPADEPPDPKDDVDDEPVADEDDEQENPEESP